MYIYFYGFHALLPAILDFSSSIIYFCIDIYVHDPETLFTHADGRVGRMRSFEWLPVCSCPTQLRRTRIILSFLCGNELNFFFDFL